MARNNRPASVFPEWRVDPNGTVFVQQGEEGFSRCACCGEWAGCAAGEAWEVVAVGRRGWQVGDEACEVCSREVWEDQA